MCECVCVCVCVCECERICVCAQGWGGEKSSVNLFWAQIAKLHAALVSNHLVMNI